MRSDMMDVLASGRSGGKKSRPPVPKKRAYDISENAPKRCKSYKHAAGGYRGWTFNPIRNMILRRIGQKWDDIYSDLATLKRKFPGPGLDNFIRWFVRTDIQMVNGYPCITHRYTKYGSLFNDGGFKPLSKNQLYVDEKGILRRAKGLPMVFKEKPITKVVVSEFLQCHRIKGIWYWMKWRPFKATRKRVFRDIFGKETVIIQDYDGLYYDWITEVAAKQRYNKPIVGVSKVQMNKRDIRKYIPEEIRCQA